MSVRALHPDRVDEARVHAYSTFAPLLIHSLAQRLARCQGMKELDKLETSLVRLVEETAVAAPDGDAMKEFAVELVVSTLRNVREHPDAKHDLEEIDDRRTAGRSENPETLEEQLQSGLEDSFPASDPPAVVSTAITGGSKDIVGTDEVLRRKKEASGRRQEQGRKQERNTN
ncbi:hypothetical protein EH240_25900 [Mesorhizobium tamadayense]|uniref:Uncharacterized protein n=1 Tax=Mesorhizobium tamadayense TaxID=425306 RepID=A0A3P3F8J5_9HYPH|nr:hypothetical protein [Mesorhizobium tamadayense]RRH94973.1 hypothetical protein EH240_25900 [Mesorhizobium tamadayense]